MMLKHKTRIFLFLCATVMTSLVSVSIQVPKFSTLDIVRIRLNSTQASNIGEVRFGIWSFCLHRTTVKGDICDKFSPCNLNGTLRLCSKPKYGYDFKLSAAGENAQSESLTPSWTRALASHAAVSIMMIICLIFLCIDYTNMLLYFIAILVAFIAFICDMAVITNVKSMTKELVKIGLAEKGVNGPGFALQIISSVWLVIDLVWDMHDKEDTINSSIFPVFPTTVSSTTPPVQLSSEIAQDMQEAENMPLQLSRAPSPIPTSVLTPPKQHRKATDGIPGKDCPICLERGKNLSELSCKHIFCTECINKSVGMYGRCPLCNKSAGRSDVRRVSVSSFV